MMDQYVTFGDLLKICSVLLDLISVILYIYYNHKNSNQNHPWQEKEITAPSYQLAAVILLTYAVGADRLLVCSFYLYYTSERPVCQGLFC